MCEKGVENLTEVSMISSDTHGDSKACNAVWSIYGACDTCLHYENLQNTDHEHVTWKRSEDFKKWQEDHLAGTAGCDRVMKLYCTGHVQKRLGKAL